MSAAVIPFPSAAGVDLSRRQTGIPTIGGNVVMFPAWARRKWRPSDITREQSEMVAQWRKKQRQLKAERAWKRAQKKKKKGMRR